MFSIFNYYFVNLYSYCLFTADLYPSNINEWEPSGSLAGVLNVIHSDIGRLQYKGRTAKELADIGIYFYESMYIPDLQGSFGRTESIPLPCFRSDEWITPDTAGCESFCCKLFNDVRNSLKIST